MILEQQIACCVKRAVIIVDILVSETAVSLLCLMKSYLSNKESPSLKWAGSAQQSGRELRWSQPLR